MAEQPKGPNICKKIFVNGKELNKELAISQITVQKSFNKISYAKIVILDGSASKRDFAISGSSTFKPGNEITIQLGYGEIATTVFKGIIVKHGIKVRQQGRSLLLIEAKDKAIKMTGMRRSDYYIDKTDSQVIKSLAKDLDTNGVEDTTLSHKQLVQFESTNWDFIVTRAEANAMLVLTDDGKLVVTKAPTSGTSVLTATYGQNIWEFEAEMDARRQMKTISGLSWNYANQAREEVADESGGIGAMSGATNGASAISNALGAAFSLSDLAEVLEAKVTLSHTGNLEHDQIKNWVEAYSLRNKLSKAIGRVRISGMASVKPGHMITLAGVGNQFNGKVLVTGVLHHYEGSWQTDIQFGWRDEWFYQKEKVMEKPAAGLLPGINGLQIGKVMEGDDEEKQLRVKVTIPTVSPTGEDAGIWARVATLDAGAEHGVFFRPQKDDEVVLGFLNDDPREPIILGYLHSNSVNKSPLPENEKSKEYGVVTKEKQKLIFDDTNKKITISAGESGKEKTIKLNEGGGLEIKNGTDASIKMDDSGITIDAGKGNITITGAKVFIN